MTDPLEHILRLAFEVGRRPAGSEGERKAGAYVAEQLEKFGFSVKTEPVRAPISTTPALLLVLLVALAGVVVGVLGQPVAAMLICAIALVLFIGETTTSLRLLTGLTPRRRSQNVVGRLAPKELPRRRLIVCANVDSPRPDLLWHPRWARRRRDFFGLLLLSFFLLPLVMAAAAATDSPLVRLAALPFAAIAVLAAFLLVHRSLRYQHVVGANGNASGVAVLLTLCEALSVDAPADTEVLALATGAHEAGLAGMQAFIKRHKDELDRAWILNLCAVGGGPVFYTTAEGLFLRHRASRELRQLAERVAASSKLNVTGRVFRLVSTDAEPLMLRRLDAMTIMAGPDGQPPNWHWDTDTVENVDADSVDTAYRFAEAIVRRFIAGATMDE